MFVEPVVVIALLALLVAAAALVVVMARRPGPAGAAAAVNLRLLELLRASLRAPATNASASETFD